MRTSAKPVQHARLWDSLPALKGHVAAASAVVVNEEREVSDIVAKALTDAASIRSAAEAKAAAMVASAHEESEIVRQDALVEGYATGLNNARSEIAEELGAKFEERCEALHESVVCMVNAIIDERNKMWMAIEGEVTSLALEIARKIVKTEVAQNTEVIEAVVKDALRRVTDRGNIRIVVNPDDLQNIRGAREDLLQAIDGIDHLVIDADRRVGRGGCMIETTAGSIDAKLETQLEQTERAMRN